MKLPGIGPKRVKAIYDELDVKSLDQLKKAAEDHEIRQLEGFGRKTEEKILREIDRRKDHEERAKLSDVDPIARSLEEYLSEVDGVKKVVVAGSFRRRKETVGDLDILITCKKNSPVMDRFVDYDEVDEVVEQGKTRSTVILQSGLQVDLRVVADVCYGAALYYFTGSKEHNVAVRKIAQKKKLKINEYGVFKRDDRIAGKTEEEVFEQAGLPYIRRLDPRQVRSVEEEAGRARHSGDGSCLLSHPGPSHRPADQRTGSLRNRHRKCHGRRAAARMLS